MLERLVNNVVLFQLTWLPGIIQKVVAAIFGWRLACGVVGYGGAVLYACVGLLYVAQILYFAAHRSSKGSQLISM